ncbi:MAG: circularly permuted type 2 ATP-grasp protein [Myxococcales bacterium]
MSDSVASPIAIGGSFLSQRYSVRPGAYDEMMGTDGVVRPAWQPLVHFLDGLGPSELGRRWEQAQQLIHENGVSFNVYGDALGMERPWRLSPIPVVIGPDEFASLSVGLTQRALLLDRLLADLYGARRALTEGWLPAEIVFAHPGFLRPCIGTQPPLGRWLHLYAADLVRPPSGEWQVLTDRTQAPSGAGYALENRIVVSRVLPDAFRDCNVQRMALFFRAMRETLASLAPHNRDNPRIVLLSPGPYNATYFEQAFLAQYLGYQLCDGGDLTVRNGRVFLKTLGGLHGVDVILRRLNDDFCDPLELRGDSTLGIPGLVEAVRAGNVAVANALGSGVLHTSALVPFLPRLCRELLGEELKLPSVETWWCGQRASLSHALDHLDQMVFRPASPGGFTQPVFGERLSIAEREELRARIRAKPGSFVAQHRVQLSTTPLLEGEEVRPRQLLLRSFLVARDRGYDVMPGGLSLVAGHPDDLEISVQRGAGSKDTWVVTEGPVSTFSMLRPPSHPVQLSRGGGDLPSRVADNLFWLGRYSERADTIARLGRTLSLRIDQADAQQMEQGEIGALLRALGTISLAPPVSSLSAGAKVDSLSEVRVPERLLLDCLFGTERHGTLRGTVREIHRVAGIIRDRISMDTWRIITALDQQMREADRGVGRRMLAAVPARLDRLVMTLAALSGVAMDGMTRGEGWRFLDMGRRLERATNLVTLLRETLIEPTLPEREGPLLEAVLEVADSGITYRRRYLASLQVAPVVDLLLTDETNPRAVAFQLVALGDHLPQLPRESARAGRSVEDRLVLASLSRLRLADVESISTPDEASGHSQTQSQGGPGPGLTGTGGRRSALESLLGELERDLPALSEALSGSYLTHATVSRQFSSNDPVLDKSR